MLLGITVASAVICEREHSTMKAASDSPIEASIARTNLSSSKNADLIYRADAAGLSNVAYSAYTKLWLSQQQNVNANLWRGFSAQRYWSAANSPNSAIHMNEGKAKEIYEIAQSCLSFAQRKAPTSAMTNLYYGNFLFWYGADETKGKHMMDGLAFMKKALALAPYDARVHTLLGAAYAEKSGNAYNPSLAEKELKIAEKGNPANAYIPWRLARVYIDLGKYAQAQQELSRCQKMVPANAMDRYYFPYYQEQISNHFVRSTEK